MKIIIIGCRGRLGSCFNGENYYLVDQEEFDIADLDKCKKFFLRIKPEAVINCAAYTKVDDAENDYSNCYLSNSLGAKNIAIASEMVKAKLCHLSTASVFDGEKNIEEAYDQTDKLNPINVYGKTKLIGEQFVKKNCSKYFIIRTNWLFGSKNDFLTSVLRLSNENGFVNAIYDQVGSFAYVKDLANFCAELIKGDLFGTYNGTNSGFASPACFIETALKYTGNNSKVNYMKLDDFNFIAKRQKNNKLKDTSSACGMPTMPHWENALYRFAVNAKI